MLSILNPHHNQHNPAFEFYRGNKVPCFETPVRQSFVEQALHARGHTTAQPSEDASHVMEQIHTARYLQFLETAWDQWCSLDPANVNEQPFPSVWPTRTLRSDIEPTNFIARMGLYSMDNGTPLAAGTWAAIKGGADAAVTAAQAVVEGEGAAFCCSRPPGHHAGADFMGGYCFLNNAALAAQTLLNGGALQVALLDVDFHHGNGTQSIFYDRDDVLFVSIHGDPATEYPFFLGHANETGEGVGAGYNLNFPLPAGCSKAAWFDALAAACAAISVSGADALVVSLGLDTFEGDPIAKFPLTSLDYFEVGRVLRSLDLPTVFVLEGGYAAEAIGTNAVNVLDGFEEE
jgi:acetoin utilization deacetylase AcuC-like enzyme